MKTQKITAIGAVREYDYEWKHFYATTLTMDNWDTWECSKSKKDYFTVWQELTYELVPNWNYPAKIKEQKKPYSGKWGYVQEDPKVKIIWFALSYAKDLYMWKEIVNVKEILKTADAFLERMDQEYNLITPKTSQETPKSEPKQEAQHSNSSLVSEAQTKYIMTLRWKLWLEESEKRRKEYQFNKYNVESLKELTKEQASEFIADLQKPDFKNITFGSPKSKKVETDSDLPF